RSALPPRAEWAGWSDAHDGADPTTARIRKVLALEALGARVAVCAADAASPAQMRAAVTLAVESFGALHGVFPSAGISAGGLIPLRSAEMARDVLRAKTHGTLALADALHGLEPDFLVLFSSISSLLGDVGQVDYCAANAFLDAYAQSRRARGAT